MVLLHCYWVLYTLNEFSPLPYKMQIGNIKRNEVYNFSKDLLS